MNMDKKYNSSKIDGVSCDAKHCIYNREGKQSVQPSNVRVTDNN